MTRLPRLLFAASLCVGTLMAPAAVHGAPDGDGSYVVQPGDYLFGIAHHHGVRLRDLLAANGLTLTSVIHPGQRLTIPTPAASTTGGTGTGTYTVRSGDSLFGIAHRHGVRLRDLLAANGLTLTSVIHPGQRLTIPTPAASTTGGTGTNTGTGTGTYTVRSGDSLFGIAHRHGIRLRDLLAANGLTLTSAIHPGQQLQIPAGSGSSGDSASSTPPTTPPTTPPPNASPTPVGAAAVEQIIRDVWPDGLEEMALAIAWRESGFVPGARSQCCYGLFQIYYDVHRGWLAGLGIDSRDDLYQPRTNAEAAYALYQRAGGWGPWALAAD